MRAAGLPMAILTAAAMHASAATPASAGHLDYHDVVKQCTGDLGDPEPGTPAWEAADENNRFCAQVREHLIAQSPARHAAVEANNALGSDDGGDPFREPALRWAGMRGSYLEIEWTDRSGLVRSGRLFGPLDEDAGPRPGVIVVCHTCDLPIPEVPSWYGDLYWWAPEMLAEHGYVVMFAEVIGNNVPQTLDATDWFVSTPEHPSPRGEVNPWHARLDRARLGIAGHSGAGGVALNVGNSDERFAAIVAWDRAGPGLDGLELRTPSMVQVADYRLENFMLVFPPRTERPVPEPGTRYTDFDVLRAAGVDTMQVAPRASSHGEWATGGSLHGELIAAYYTLAWFDRYLRRSDTAAADALRRLTATDTFDRSADVYSISSGFFDAVRAEGGSSVEAGNVPVTIGGLSVRNLLSFWYPTRYFLDGGALECEDVRAGCPGRKRDGSVCRLARHGLGHPILAGITLGGSSRPSLGEPCRRRLPSRHTGPQ